MNFDACMWHLPNHWQEKILIHVPLQTFHALFGRLCHSMPNFARYFLDRIRVWLANFAFVKPSQLGMPKVMHHKLPHLVWCMVINVDWTNLCTNPTFGIAHDFTCTPLHLRLKLGSAFLVWLVSYLLLTLPPTGAFIPQPNVACMALLNLLVEALVQLHCISSHWSKSQDSVIVVM